jgi:alkylation response protein AidB-like acyl-CoA dehydrogenase
MESNTLEGIGNEQETMAGAGVLWDAVDRPRPTMPELQGQLDEAAAALEAGLAQNELAPFYDLLRSTDLPTMALLHAGDPRGLAHLCCKILHRFGGISPAVGLAFENHLYLTCAVVTFPRQDEVFEARRRALLRLLGEERPLVANTNSRVHGDKLASLGVVAQPEGDGFRIRGSAAYLSLSTQADLLIFFALLEGVGPALFQASVRDNPGIEIGPFLFPRAMLDSDTRRVTFQDLVLPAESLLMSGMTEQMSWLNLFEMSWHQLLIGALYLGGAARAIDEARLFLRSIRGQDDHPLAELDGMMVDIGRLVIRYRAAWALVERTADRLGEASRKPLDSVSLGELFDFASMAKYAGTMCAEEVVTAARRIIGTRSFAGAISLPIERLSLEIPFGPLGPEVNAIVERRLGRRSLGETPPLVEPL